MKQHDGFIKNSDVNVLLAGGGHKPLSEFLDTSSLKTVNGQSLIGIGDINVGGEIIVPSSGSTLTAEVGKYYRYDTIVNSLTVTLPSTALFTSTQKIMIYFQAGTSNSLTLSSTDYIRYMNGYDIEGGSTYEVTIMWNGYSWIVTSIEMDWLPAGAKRIEYLQSDGNQWTRFPNILGQVQEFEFVFMPKALGAYSAAWVFGSWEASSGANGFSLDIGSGSFRLLCSSTYPSFTLQQFSKSVSITLIDNLTTFSVKPTGEVYLNGSNIDTGTFYITETINDRRLFGVAVSGTFYSQSMRIYSFKLKTTYGKIEIIPIRIGNTGYMYEKFSKTLLSNLGTGNFILGPDR